MRILVVGAGAVGGYFGGRLAEAGCDVTFLVRERRAAQLAETGLVIKSCFGDAVLRPKTISAEKLDTFYDIVLLSCKAYDLESAIDSFAPAVGPQTIILPVLNGMRHLEQLDDRFGSDRVLGGLCQIVATLDTNGAILHLSDSHLIVFGERTCARSPRVDAIAALMAPATFGSRAGDTILLDMWEKWVFLATLAGMTCLMRASLGDIAKADGSGISLDLFAECCSIAENSGYAPRQKFIDRIRGMLKSEESSLTASMLRDIERGGPIEVDHIIGDLLRRSPENPSQFSLLRIAHIHLKTYEVRRQRLA
ncbi:MAG: 2-dehydropantoate 2-reductase [Desulfuromonadales bacterium]|nr:2-dehydropantoate 2-reductase [Desulfuromonadales bacterium]